MKTLVEAVNAALHEELERDPSVFVTRPISGVLLLLAVVVLGLIVMPAIKKKREEVFVEDE